MSGNRETAVKTEPTSRENIRNSVTRVSRTGDTVKGKREKQENLGFYLKSLFVVSNTRGPKGDRGPSQIKGERGGGGEFFFFGKNRRS